MTDDPVVLRSALDALRDKWREASRAEVRSDVDAEANLVYEYCAEQLDSLLTDLPLPQLLEKEEDTASRVDGKCDVPTAGSTANTAYGCAPTLDEDDGA